jgi:Arc/MetJ-type ribon-helix-helix transcriptional regulator
MADKPDKSKGWLKLPEPLASDVEDFLAASYHGRESDLVHEALREHIDRRLEEPEMKRRFERARASRLGRHKEPLKLITPNGDHK